VKKTALLILLSLQTAFAQIPLDGLWAFRTDPNNVGEKSGWFQSQASIVGWDSLPVPGNWDLRNEYAHFVGKGWYRRSFATPSGAKGRITRLIFEAVYHDCSVWLNGQKLGENHSGFLPFEFNISENLNPTGLNTLVVCADNTFKRGAIWNWGGIRRPVTLEVSEPLRLVRQHITPTVDLSAGTASVAVRVFLQNHADQAATARGEVVISGKNGVKKSLPFTAEVPAHATQSVLVKTNFSKQETHLWHFDDPFLYEAEARLPGQKEPVRNRFGLRKIEVDNQAFTLKLNGESIRPMGFNLVPDDRTTGNTLPLWRIREDVDLLKSLGCTMTRLSHLMLPEAVLDYLDERGMLVISEIPLWGFDPLADPASPTPKDWLNRLILTQYNHPCVVGWSVGNEIGDYPTTMKYVEAAVAHVRTLDSTRLVSAVSHTANRSPDFIQFGDLGLINKYGKNLGPVTELQHQHHPNKTLFYAEYGIGQLTEDLDANLDSRSLLDSLRNRPYLIGGSLWTFNDYRSNFYGTKEFSENRPWGVVDVFRRKKRAFYTFQKEQAPVREFRVVTTGPTSATLTITPRNRLDLPAFPLRGYRVVWQLREANGRIQEGGIVPLPVVQPGEAALKRPIAWTGTDAYALNVALLSPQGDALTDTTVFFGKPFPVNLVSASGVRSIANDTRPNTGLIRVFFEKNPATATAYKVRYGLNNLTQETAPTTNDFIDVPKLAFDQTYQIALIGINGAGESEPGAVQSIGLESRDFAAPVIRHVQPADGGFFVGYATDDDDFLFRVQVTTTPGNYTDALTIQTTNPGVLFVPNLTNGRRYYFRLQRLKDNNGASLWTPERAVTPDGGQLPPVPILDGVIRQGAEAVVCFQPVPKATGYALEYRSLGKKPGAWHAVAIETAQVGRAFLQNLDSKNRYEYRLATRNTVGQTTRLRSEFSSPVTELNHVESRSRR